MILFYNFLEYAETLPAALLRLTDGFRIVDATVITIVDCSIDGLRLLFYGPSVTRAILLSYSLKPLQALNVLTCQNRQSSRIKYCGRTILNVLTIVCFVKNSEDYVHTLCGDSIRADVM